MSGLYKQLTKILHRIYDSRIFDPPILNTASRFPDAQHFVNAWPALREEALWLAQNIGEIPRFHELMAEQAEISANDKRDWRMFVLKAYGIPMRQNLSQCPELTALVESTPDVLSATLSFLAPNKHIPIHRGPFRGVLRFYLGLSIPLAEDGRPSTVLKINGIEHRVREGECLLWDDTFPHEVWNHSDKLRIALLLDIRRGNMPLTLTLLSRLIIRAVGVAVRMRLTTEPKGFRAKN